MDIYIRTVIKIHDGGCRHLRFQNIGAISLLLDQSSPNLVEILRLQTYQNISMLSPNAQMAAAPTLECKQLMLFFTIQLISTKIENFKFNLKQVHDDKTRK